MIKCAMLTIFKSQYFPILQWPIVHLKKRHYLTNSTLYQSYYTALSRTANADGISILQSFSFYPITWEASGCLRQEFYKLELLDDITKMAYDSVLPN